MTDLTPKWSPWPSDTRIAPDEVHVWRTACRPESPSIHDLAQLLSAEERQRAARFYFERDRACYITSHGALRLIIGRYTGLSHDLQFFGRGPKGKPYLTTSLAQGRLEFNLAHSRELIVLAFTLDRRIGIDLEFQKPMPRARQIADRFFSPRERRELDRIPPQELGQAFFNCWTRKEALAKATGRGLAGFMDKFSVSLAPDQKARLLEIESGLVDATQWSMESFTPAPGYKAALALEGEKKKLLFWQLTDSQDNWPVHPDKILI